MLQERGGLRARGNAGEKCCLLLGEAANSQVRDVMFGLCLMMQGATDTKSIAMMHVAALLKM
jgi:hypothetical protein